jgi:hypothetical protein
MLTAHSLSISALVFQPTFASECCSCESMRGEDISNMSAAGPGIKGSFNADCVREQVQCAYTTHTILIQALYSYKTEASNGKDYMTGTMVWTLFGQ